MVSIDWYCYSDLRVFSRKNESGDYSEEVTPVPISNTAVKLFSAQDTRWETARESKTLPVRSKNGFVTVFFNLIHIYEVFSLLRHKESLTSFFLKISGAYSEEVTPVPISNTAVKLFSAYDTWWVTAWESGTVPVILEKL